MPDQATQVATKILEQVTAAPEPLFGTALRGATLALLCIAIGFLIGRKLQSKLRS